MALSSAQNGIDCDAVKVDAVQLSTDSVSVVLTLQLGIVSVVLRVPVKRVELFLKTKRLFSVIFENKTKKYWNLCLLLRCLYVSNIEWKLMKNILILIFDEYFVFLKNWNKIESEK